MIFDSARRMGATVLAMLQTRLALAAVELEEEAQRYARYAVLALVALILFGLALVLAAFFVVLLFWESYRLEAVGALVLLFGGGALFIVAKLKNAIAGKPRFMAHTADELHKDLSTFRRHHD